MRRNLVIIGYSIALATIVSAIFVTRAASTLANASPPVIVEVRGTGFHWGNAAIGGSAVLGAVLATFGAALAIRRPHRTPHGGDHD